MSNYEDALRKWGRYLGKYTLKWFFSRYEDFTPAQKMAIPYIKEGRNVLISSPTGTGKTLAAFLAIIDDLVALALKGELEDKVYAVYVSPLRALDNDMRRNLNPPLEGIYKLLGGEGRELPEIRVAVRTGDTTPSERSRMLRKPPHILITTPESLALAITAPKFRLRLSGVRWVLVDEIHELASSKRGAHLALTLERLQEIVEGGYQRIGLSATIYPLEKVAEFLVGFSDDGTPRDYVLVDARFVKPMKIKVLSPEVDIVTATAGEINEAIYKLLKKVIKKHRTTLVFTNTRSATERVVYKLKKVLKGEGIADVDEIEAHHSSLSREVRLEVEEKLKKGELKVVVCVAPDTEVLTKKGPVSITQLSGNEEILTYIGGDVRFSKHGGIYETRYYGEGIKVVTDSGRSITVTKSHRFLRSVEGKEEWVEAHHLRVGDALVVVDEGEEGHYRVHTEEITELRSVYLEKAYGVLDVEGGTFISNGFVSKNSSSSLELGIDIGYIDAVVLLSSPKSVTRLIQRVGRSGHSVKDVSKGYVIAVDRDDLVEDAVLAKLAMERKLDRIRIPRKPMDILAQHLVGMSLERKWRIIDAYRVVKRAYNYRDLTFDEFMNVLRYLAGRFAVGVRNLPVYSKLWMDEVEGVFGRKRSARVIYYLNSGAIPDEAKVRVFLDGKRYVGDLEEGFVEYLEPGDVFVLGGRTYRFVKSKGLKIIVKSAEGSRPTVPSWYSEVLPLTYDSAVEVGRFRRKVAQLLKEKGFEGAVRSVKRELKVSIGVARNIVRYVWEQMRYTGECVPGDEEVLVEVWEDRSAGELDLIFHYLFGRRVNSALSRAYAAVLSDEVTSTVRVTVTDNGFMLTLPSWIALSDQQIMKVIEAVNETNLRSILAKSLRRSEIIKRRFRHVAERSFAILRNYKGRETSINRRQLNSEVLFRAAESIKDFPLIKEVYREVMEDFMDVGNAEEVLRKIREGRIKVTLVRSYGVPSPFAHSIVVHGYSDIVLMEDRRKFLIKLYRQVMEKIGGGDKPDA
ncbi:MAG: DEAD/DEAH box helicase [Desulfurococcales archaeon]|nr:DEAD/DEAH box helicase [Desulfurococcales archaeon]